MSNFTQNSAGSTGVRPAVRVVAGHPSADGAGVKIHRVAGFQLKDLSPFLMVDEIRSENPDDYIAGFPPHPHRGIETLTYMLSGEFEHQDHLGNRGAIKQGGAQWMRAGRGIIHSEMPHQPKDGGSTGMHGFQLWINMAAKDKMSKPVWRDIQPEQMREIMLDGRGSKIRLIAGQWQVNGKSEDAPLLEAAAQASVADLRLAAGAEVNLPLPAGHTVMTYVYSGALDTGHGVVNRGNLVLFGDGESLQLRAPDDAPDVGTGMLILRGSPLGEPVVHYGPFVMNTREEIEQAVRDYNNGTLTD
ncbi:pirin family protein [Microbulbifer harenosus]|uniref:Pirin family protein n=1 Tax=Microbulbifer harenosus TaxID=2576840 RepID=A0ABY2UKX8_9GAMM|nr:MULTISPECIES: pirin family protein [Microbulbifer]QIL90762.1 pirin family protein [Microbulbifer sp. SH-1]TLM78975.1 pirin family protein [Microbulbifer harenosus]